MRKFKHKTTRFIAELNSTEEFYVVCNLDEIIAFQLPKEFVENSNDWEEIFDKPNLEVGKIYKSEINKYKTMLLILSKNDDNTIDVIGFDVNGDWCERTSINFYKGIEATKEEWFERLKEEAIRQGLVIGVKFKSAFNNLPYSLNNYILGTDLSLTTVDATLMDSITGKWATPIEEKKPILTTHDGVELFEDNNVYGASLTDNEMPIRLCKLPFAKFHNYKNRVWFSTKEAAEEYIKWNKPLYSLNDVQTVIRTKTHTIAINCNEIMKELKKLNK